MFSDVIIIIIFFHRISIEYFSIKKKVVRSSVWLNEYSIQPRPYQPARPITGNENSDSYLATLVM